MAKEHITLMYGDSGVDHFTATKPGRRGAKDVEKLHDQFEKSGVRVLRMHQSGGDQPGFTIKTKALDTTQRLMLKRRVKACFVKAGYKITELPRGSTK